MKPSLKLLSTSISSVIALGFLAGVPSTAQALTWFDGGTGNWDNATSNWNTGASNLSGNTTWSPGATATFKGAGSTVTITDGLDIGAISFDAAAGGYTFDNTGGNVLDITAAGISSASVSAQLISSNGVINFKNASTAGNATITISNNGAVNFQGTSTAGTSVLSNTGDLTFEGASSAGSAAIDNLANLIFTGTSTGSTAAISNGGILDISGHTGNVAFGGALTNSSGGIAGAVTLGSNQLQVGGLTLAAFPQSLLDFELNAPGTSGSIKLTGGSFTGAGLGQVNIALSDLVNPGGVAAGTYTLIDWTGFSAAGVDVSDFVLGALPAGLSGSTHLEIQGTTLVLVAVPEPATFVMPLMAALGMLWLRRRSGRVTA